MKLELRRVTVSTPRAQDARRRWPERESLLVRLTDAEGYAGIGEASPLPGYSCDTLAGVQAALGSVSAAELAAALTAERANDALAAVARLAPPHLPAARMALETAALDLLGARHGRSAPLLLGATPDARRPLAQLLGPASSVTLIDDAERAVRHGYRHLKLKIGAPGELAAEIKAICSLRERVGSSVSLRLDANGSLSLAELEAAWAALRELEIELFEEPGAVPESLIGRLPLALDESLQGLSEQQVEALLRRTHATAIVVKPMALGGLSHCHRLASLAQSLGVAVVVSHCFDGPFAFQATAALALALPPGLAHGLAPHAGLDAWALRQLPVTLGVLEAWQEPGLAAPAEHGFS
jgi:o-succinylbenzoate synthase